MDSSYSSTSEAFSAESSNGSPISSAGNCICGHCVCGGSGGSVASSSFHRSTSGSTLSSSFYNGPSSWSGTSISTSFGSPVAEPSSPYSVSPSSRSSIRSNSNGRSLGKSGTSNSYNNQFALKI